MYKLQVHSGIGDCLRIINDCRIVSRCEKEKVKCCINFKILKDEPWTYANRDTFIRLIESVPIFEYVDDEAFADCSYRLANAECDKKNYIQERRLTLPINFTASQLPEQFDAAKLHIAVQTTGSTKHKEFSNELTGYGKKIILSLSPAKENSKTITF